MSHSLSISDGTRLVSLSSSGAMLTYYVPQAPATKDGQLEPVTESIEFSILGSSPTDAQDRLHALEQLLFGTIQRQWTGTGLRIYLQLQLSGEASSWRSEIISYTLQPGPDSLQSFGQSHLAYRLTVTRAPYWEGARTAIPLTNGNGTDNTSGLTVWNHDDSDAGQDNWLAISSTAITGSLPSPLELQLTNSSGASRAYYDFHIANNTFATGLAHIVEGESRVSGWGVNGSDSSCSGGQYTGLTGSGWLHFRWLLSTAQVNYIAGRYVRILARFRSLAGVSIPLKITLMDSAGASVVADPPPITTDSRGAAIIHDCGAIPIPAADFSSGWSQHTLQLSLYAASSTTVDVDFIQLTPTEPLAYQKIIQRGYSVPNGASVVANGTDGLVYYESVGVRYPIYVAYTEPVHVYPGVNQRLYILQSGSGQSISWTMTAKAWYRPRRSTL